VALSTSWAQGESSPCSAIFLERIDYHSKALVTTGTPRKTWIKEFVTLLEFDSGERAYFKVESRVTNPRYEVAAYQLSEFLGLHVVPRTEFYVLDGIHGSLQREVVKISGYPKEFSPGIRFLDFLTGNEDRMRPTFQNIGWTNNGVIWRNVAIDTLGVTWAIDNGYANIIPSYRTYHKLWKEFKQNARKDPAGLFPGKMIFDEKFEREEFWQVQLGTNLTQQEIHFIFARFKEIIHFFQDMGNSNLQN